MPYRKDADLEFLKYCSDDQLKDLADILIFNEKGARRWSDSLSSDKNFRLARQTGAYASAWREIAAEFQRYGGDTIANFLRGRAGVTYRVILRDLCADLKVEYDSNAPIEEVEEAFTLGIFERALQGMTAEERKRFVANPDLLIEGENYTVPALMSSLILLFNTGGVAAYGITMTLLNAISTAFFGRALTYAASQTVVSSLMVFSGPVGWTLNFALFLPLFTGPNKKVVLLAALYIATLRRSGNMVEDDEKDAYLRGVLDAKSKGLDIEETVGFAGGGVKRSDRNKSELIEKKKKRAAHETKKNRPKETIQDKKKPRPFMRRIRVDKDREMEKF